MGSLIKGRRRLAGVLLLVLIGCRTGAEDNPERSDRDAAPVIEESAERTPTPHSLRVPSEKLSRIEIVRKKGGAEHLIVVERRPEGWMVASPIEYRAHQLAVDGMMAVLAEIEVQSILPQDRRARLRQGLGDDAGIEVKAWDGESVASHFVVGHAAREQTYVQRVGEPHVFLVGGRCRRFFDNPLDELRHPVITSFDPKHVAGVTYDNEFGRLEFVPDPANPGMFVEKNASIRNFDQDRALKNVAVISGLYAKGFVDPPLDRKVTSLFEARTPRARLLVKEGAKQLTIDVWVGSRTTDGRLHLRTSQSDQVFLISAHLESSLVPRSSHFERSDEMMRELRTHREKQGPKHSHGHAKQPPSQVPLEMLRELRVLARKQR